MNEIFARRCILIVDDHVEIVRTLVINFRARGYRTLAAPDAKTALSLVAEMSPDAIVLDLGLPDMDGTDLITQIRRWSDIPILVLSGRTELDKKISALNAGADDYISKPFEIDELIARVEAVFRRIKTTTLTPIYLMGTWRIDLSKHQISDVSGVKEDAHLTPIEWRLIEKLLSKAGGLVPQKELLQDVWGAEYEKETNYLRLYISQLRRKLETDARLPEFILTEPGIGYRLNAIAPAMNQEGE
ncbi:MAG: response regulator [Actinobacteria bacterium]|nr:response regulator [Actinomycetota bacterium]